MLNCPHCGTDNALGCVFCRTCGSKLDLSDVTSKQVAKATRPSPLRRIAPVVLIVVAVLGLLAFALAAWPKDGRIGEEGTLVGARRVEQRLLTFSEVREGAGLGADPAFTEKDLNGYFSFFKTRLLRLSSCSVSIKAGTMRVRAVRPLGKLDIGKMQFTPRMSYDFRLAPAGKSVTVKEAWVGHLPLLGPLKSRAVRRLSKVFASQPDWRPLTYVKEVRFGDGTVAVVVQR